MKNILLKKPGIYCIKNIISGKEYVGSTARSIHRRLQQHFADLRRGDHYNLHLQRSFNKYGKGYPFLMKQNKK